MIYIVVFIILLFFAWLFDARHHGTNQQRKMVYSVVFFILALLAGLRYRIGTDTLTYENWFESSWLPTLDKLTWDDFSYNRFEPLFVFLGVVVKTIFGNHWIAFQIIHALIVNYAFFWAFRKYSRYPFICVAIYYIWLFYPLNCEIMRQSLATAIWIFSLPFLFDKKYWKYYLIVFACFFIHRSSFFFAVLPFLKFLDNRKIVVASIFVLLLLAKPLSDYVSNNLFMFIELFASSEGATDTLMNYADSESLMSFEFSIIGTIVFLFDGVLVFMIMKLVVNKHIEQKNLLEKEDIVLNNCGYILSLFLILQMANMALPIFYRFSWLFSLFPILFFADFLGGSRWKKDVLELAYLVSVVFLFSIRIYTDNAHEEDSSGLYYYQRYYPYSSVLNPERDQKRENIFFIYNK